MMKFPIYGNNNFHGSKPPTSEFTQTGNIHFSFVIPVATPTQATSTSHRAVIWIPAISAWISCGPGPRHKEGISSDNFGAFCKKNDGLSILKP
jgi:hypothetical protein